jgi:hypothetical protein
MKRKKQKTTIRWVEIILGLLAGGIVASQHFSRKRKIESLKKEKEDYMTKTRRYMSILHLWKDEIQDGMRASEWRREYRVDGEQDTESIMKEVCEYYGEEF